MDKKKKENGKIGFDNSSKSDISSRKDAHLNIPLNYDVQHTKNYLDDIKLLHHGIPEIDYNEVDITTSFFGKEVSAPICIAAITGGGSLPKKVNEVLSRAAEEEKIIMGVGSQRIALEDKETLDSFQIVRDSAPSIPIIGNIGIGQICKESFSAEEMSECIEMIEADAIAIHFNSLQELIQRDGDTSYTNFQEKFSDMRKSINVPFIAKGVGAGFSKEAIDLLESIGFEAFDVGGMGGTSFAAIEGYREKNHYKNLTRQPSKIFREWGIPTPISILYAREITKKCIIATGGLRNGIDIAKCVSLGADLGGIAYNFLKTAIQDTQNKSINNTLNEIKTLKYELKSAMWLINVQNLASLKYNKRKIIFLGQLQQWLRNKK